MSLQNLFEMVKADRYTADGCEALNKAREADVEDRRYKNGEISETTGLMKTPKGWVEPPKGGRTPKGNNSGMSKHWVQKGEKAEFVERTPQEEKAMWEKVAARQSDDKLKLAIKNREGKELNPVEKIKLETAKEELAKRQGGADWTKDIPNATTEELENVVKLEAKLPKMSEQSRKEFAPKIEKAKQELANREIDKKTKANPDYPFKPKTESERAERAKFEKDRDDFIERMDKIRQENNKSKSNSASAKFDEYGLPSKETVELKENFLRKKGVSDPNKLSNKEFNDLAKELDDQFGINNLELSQELLVTPVEESRESASEWITSANGDRMQVSEAQNKIMSNQQKIDNLKKEMEGKSKTDNFRAGAELKRLENENEYLRERVPNTAKDCAPRQLTGDCKIRVRKS